MIRKLIAFATLATLPLAAPASPNGLAWDSVTKIVMNAAPASLQPGSFDADFAAAASVQQPEQNGGGIFNQMKQAMAMGQSMQQMMQYGFAARHYVAGSKERTDDLALQTATIVDCAARTITTLDLRRKTYRVVSMDQSSATSSGGGGGGPQAGATQDNTRIAISVANTALGGREVAGQFDKRFSLRHDYHRNDLLRPNADAKRQPDCLLLELFQSDAVLLRRIARNRCPWAGHDDAIRERDASARIGGQRFPLQRQAKRAALTGRTALDVRRRDLRYARPRRNVRHRARQRPSY